MPPSTWQQNYILYCQLTMCLLKSCHSYHFDIILLNKRLYMCFRKIKKMVTNYIFNKNNTKLSKQVNNQVTKLFIES